ncbi:MAG: MDR family MFS transporter [Kyrpidia sp.]|nr:MDR family MFS transporter [Kyrpidia sp.]
MKQTNRKWVTVCLMAAMFLSAMEATIVATAMPTIAGKLGGFSQFTWVFSIFLLTQAASIPIYGKLADLYGRKPVFAAGTGLFIIGSALCGFARSMPMLIAFRAVQGLGAGAVQPIATTIIGDLYPGPERAKVQGLLSSMWAIAAIVGPALGGLLVQTIGWPWIFELNVPLGILTIAGIVLFLHERVQRKQHRIDYGGAATLFIAVTALLTALLQGGVAWPWNSPKILGLFAVFLVFLALFLWIQTKAEEPMLPLTLLRRPVIAAANLCALITGGIMLGASSFLPTFAQGVLGTSAILAGGTIVTVSIGWPIASTLSGRLIWRWGYRALEVAGLLFCTLSGALYLTITPDTPPWYLAGCSLILGVGLGLASTTQIVAIQTSVPWQQRGIATGSNMFARILGSTLGVAAMGTVVNSALSRLLSATPLAHKYQTSDPVAMTNLLLDPARRALLPPGDLTVLTGALARSIHLTFWVLLAAGLVGTAVSVGMPGGVPKPAEEPERSSQPESRGNP